MARMRMPTGEVYEVPDAEVRIAQSQYGAVPDTAGATPGPVGGGNDLLGAAAGMGSSALDAIGGPRTLLVGAGGLAGAAGLKHLMGRGKPAAPSGAPAPAPATLEPSMPQPGRAKIPAGLVELSEADIKRFPQLKNYQPGETIRRAALEAIKLGPEPGAKGSPAEKRVAAPAMARKPRPMQGASNPALERRTAARAAATGKSPPAMGDMDLEAALRQSVELEQTGKQAGLSAAERSTVRSQGRTNIFKGPRMRAGLNGIGGGANLLLALLGAADTPEQMAEAEAIYLQSRLEGAPPSLQRALTDEDEIY